MSGPTGPEHATRRHLMADFAFAALQQGGVAATITTIWILAPRIGEDKAILVGLLVGLAAACVAVLTRKAIRDNGQPPGQGDHRSNGSGRAY